MCLGIAITKKYFFFTCGAAGKVGCIAGWNPGRAGGGRERSGKTLCGGGTDRSDKTLGPWN